MESDVYERGRCCWRIVKQLSVGFSVFYKGSDNVQFVAQTKHSRSREPFAANEQHPGENDHA